MRPFNSSQKFVKKIINNSITIIFAIKIILNEFIAISFKDFCTR